MIAADRSHTLRRVRLLIGFVIFGLVVSGLTAFPLEVEANILQGCLRRIAAPAFVMDWIGKVQAGLTVVGTTYPFLAYGTDWLAFGHLIIALFFVAPLIDPVRNVAVLRLGVIACVLVIPLALICGGIRGIPLWWRGVDCMFGVIGAIPLCLALRLVRRMVD